MGCQPNLSSFEPGIPETSGSTGTSSSQSPNNNKTHSYYEAIKTGEDDQSYLIQIPIHSTDDLQGLETQVANGVVHVRGNIPVYSQNPQTGTLEVVGRESFDRPLTLPKGAKVNPNAIRYEYRNRYLLVRIYKPGIPVPPQQPIPQPQ